MASASLEEENPSLLDDELQIEDALYVIVKRGEEFIKLQVVRDIELRHVQRILCNSFRERFPLMLAMLSDSEDRIFDEFNDTPFKHAKQNDIYTVSFDITRDMFWFDWADRKCRPSRLTPHNVCELPLLSLE